jgi:hypothetical protein
MIPVMLGKERHCDMNFLSVLQILVVFRLSVLRFVSLSCWKNRVSSAFSFSGRSYSSVGFVERSDKISFPIPKVWAEIF